MGISPSETESGSKGTEGFEGRSNDSDFPNVTLGVTFLYGAVEGYLRPSFESSRKSAKRYFDVSSPWLCS